MLKCTGRFDKMFLGVTLRKQRLFHSASRGSSESLLATSSVNHLSNSETRNPTEVFMIEATRLRLCSTQQKISVDCSEGATHPHQGIMY